MHSVKNERTKKSNRVALGCCISTNDMAAVGWRDDRKRRNSMLVGYILRAAGVAGHRRICGTYFVG